MHKDRVLAATLAKLTAHHKQARKAPGELPHGWHPNVDEWQLDVYTRSTGNTVLLIRYLRRVASTDAILQPVLATLLADILDGKLTATKKRFTRFEPEYLRDLCSKAKMMLNTGDPKVLAQVGLQHVPATKGELTAVAVELAAKHVGLSPRAFEDRLNPSSKRGKRG